MSSMSKVVRAIALAMVVLVAGANPALAADLQTDVSASLSTDATVPTAVEPGANTFQIKVWATGNLANARSATVVTAYSMAADGTITPVGSQTVSLPFAARHYTQDCPTTNAPLGCAANPHIVTATLTVAPAAPDGKTGTVTVSHSSSGSGLAPDGTPAKGYVVVDIANTNPVLTVPASMIVEGNTVGGATVTFAGLAASDAEDGDITADVDCTPADGSFFALGGPTTVSCSVADAASATDADTFQVTVVDTTDPILAGVPANIAKEATSSAGAAAAWTAPTASDIVDASPSVTCQSGAGLGSNATFPLGVTTVTCTALDASGNDDTGSFTVSVNDTTGPTLSDVPGNINAEATAASGASVTWDPPTATDAADPNAQVACEGPGPLGSGDTFPIGTTTVTCTARDLTGNSTVAGFTVTVEDTTAPTFTAPVGVTVEAIGPAGATASWTTPIATDAVDGAPTVVCASAGGSSSGDVFPLGATTVSCTATDAAGNTSEAQTFIVTVEDTTAPTFTAPVDVTEEATGPTGAAATWTTPIATDAVDAAPTVACASADGLTSGDTFPLGATTVSCTATDVAGNTSEAQTFIVTVEDTTAPTFVAPANILEEATGPTGATVTWTTPIAIDAVDASPTVACASGDGLTSGDTFPLGVTTVTCTALDASGNDSQDAFTVSVNDTIGPDLAGVPSDLIVEAESASGAPVSWDPPTATDAVDPDPSVTCESAGGLGAGDTFPIAVTAVTCTALDSSGNDTVQGFTVTVEDSTAPTLAAPSNVTREATGASGAVVTFDDPTATDAVDPTPSVTCASGTGLGSGDTFPIGITEVSCTATDAAGNTSDAQTFAVTVEDTTAPTFTAPSDITVEATSGSGATATWTTPAAVDVVDSAPTVSCESVDGLGSGDTFPLGATVVSCTASDATGNTSLAQTFTVTVEDTTGPVLTLPSNVVKTSTSGSAAAVTYTASASDLVDGTVVVTCSPASGATFPVGATSVSCKAADAAGNEETGSFTVTVSYGWTGFFQPIDNPTSPSVLNWNKAKAGSVIPVKFSLGGNQGLSIFAGGAPKVVPIACPSGTVPADAIEELASSNASGLKYDAAADQYNYAWKTASTYAGKCFRLDVLLADGSPAHSAYFTFTK